MKLADVVLKRLNRALHRLQRQLGLRHGSLRARVRYEWGGDGAWACAKVWASLVAGNEHLDGPGLPHVLDRLRITTGIARSFTWTCSTARSS